MNFQISVLFRILKRNWLLIVQVPTKLNEEAKEALRKFDEACGNVNLDEKKGGSEKSEKKKKSFMDKLKETFED